MISNASAAASSVVSEVVSSSVGSAASDVVTAVVVGCVSVCVSVVPPPHAAKARQSEAAQIVGIMQLFIFISHFPFPSNFLDT